MKTAKKPSIDRLGRVVVPKAIREQAGLQPGMPLSIRYDDGRIEIEPEAAEVEIVARGKLRVAVPAQALPTLSAEAVRRTQDKVRKDRG